MSHLNPTPDELGREGGLPVWARKVIDALRNDYSAMQESYHRAVRKVDELETQITVAAESDTGPEDSTAWLFRTTEYDTLPRLGLGADAIVEFTPTGGAEFSVEIHGNGIKVTSQAMMMVIPIDRYDFRIQPVHVKIED